MRLTSEITEAERASLAHSADKAVLLLAHGGPTRLDEVPDFLRSVMGRPPSAEAVARVGERYRRIGGASPAPSLAHSLAKKLAEATGTDVQAGFLHAHPSIEEAVDAVRGRGARRVLAICLVPQFSEVGIGPYRRRLEAAAATTGIEWTLIADWHAQPAFIAGLAESLSEVLPADTGTHVVFTAHSLPQSAIPEGDPYQEQLLETAELVAAHAGLPPSAWTLAYQGAVGGGQGWLGPGVQEVIQALAGRGTLRVVVCPIGFVLDQVETLYDLDIVLQKQASELGLKLVRTRALNDGAPLVEVLAGLVWSWREDQGMGKGSDVSQAVTEEAALYPWPRIVFWETTAVCNLECSHCRRTDVPGEAPPDELSTPEAERVIDEMAGWGRTLLILSGGEPLLRQDIFHLARYGVERGLIVALASNATLIDAAVARRIADSGIQRVSVSLDGADPATHDAFRRQPGAFAASMKGIDALRAEGVPVQINVTVARHNVEQMNEMVALAKRVGAVALHLFLLVPVGCGVEIAEEQTITPEEYERTLVWLYETERVEPDLQLKATCAPHYFRVVRQQQAAERRAARSAASREGEGPSPGDGASEADSRAPAVAAMPASTRRQAEIVATSSGHPGADGRPAVVAHPGAGGHPGPGALHASTRGCLAGIGVCFISHIGKVYGCGYMPAEAGDLRLESFSDVWQGSRLFAELRDFEALKGRCGICEYKRVCGGCRARAYGVTGDYLAEEPFCTYQPARAARQE